MERYRFVLRERLASLREWIDNRTPWRFELVLLACLLVGLTALLCSEYLPSLRGLSEGSPSPRTIVATKPVTVVDLEATEKLKARAADLVAPVYLPDTKALPAASAKVQTFLDTVARHRLEVAEGVDAGAAIQVAIQELKTVSPDLVSGNTLRYLLKTDDATFALICTQVLGALETLSARPITDQTLGSARFALRSLVNDLVANPLTANAVYEVAAGFLGPNQIVDHDQTEARREAAVEQVTPVMVSIDKGQVVLQKGEQITAQDMLVLKELGLVGIRSGWKVWVGIFLLMLLETALFSRLLHRFNKTTEEYGNNMLLALVFLLLGTTGVARLLIIEPLSAYVIPVAALGMVVAIVLNARSALLLVTLASVNIGLLTNLDMRYALVAMIAGGLSLYLVSRVTKRAALLGAGLATMILAALAIFSVELFMDSGAGDALRASAWGLGNGFLSGVLTIIGLNILETVFNLTTPLRLLELADPAHPLVKKLLQVAPGTYNHSIQMGNLAEAAAEAIGANPLLARVGAYYHDIGKIIRPEYFVENQLYVENPHDHLSPNLSKLAITAHVRDGEHLARMYGLPKPVVDIIKQHHGTSVLAYFYHKALESTKDVVYEESYRYEEQKPQSKEAAIIMLADSVEAAVRAMENPTPRKIQGVIQEIIKQKVEDGQLDESALTQSDLRKIRDAFEATLIGMVGHRIPYPQPEGCAGQEEVGSTGRETSRRPPSAEAMRGGGFTWGGVSSGNRGVPSSTELKENSNGTAEQSGTSGGSPARGQGRAVGSGRERGPEQ